MAAPTPASTRGRRLRRTGTGAGTGIGAGTTGTTGVCCPSRGHQVTTFAAAGASGASPARSGWRARSRAASVPASGRWVGSGARHCRTTGQSASGKPAGATGTQLMCRYSTSDAAPPRNGDRPQSSSYRTMPSAYTSVEARGGAPPITSGAMYSGVA